MHMQHGLLITLEGIDGAGTTTQVPRIKDYLERLGYAVHTTAQPSSGPIGAMAREVLRSNMHMDEATLALLFAADRLQHLHADILPKLAQGMVVVCDRYLLSSYAYQGSVLPIAWIQDINTMARPADVCIFFDVAPDIAEQRRQLRGGTHEHFDAADKQAQIAQRYAQHLQDAALLKRVSMQTLTIDANASIDNVTEALQHKLTWILQQTRQQPLC